MRYLIKFLLPSLLFSSLYGFWSSPCFNGHVGIEAEWLYFRPATEKTIVRTQIGARTDYLTNVPAYDSGWRIGANYQFNDCLNAFAVRWTQFKTTHDNYAFAPSVSILGGGIADATNMEVVDTLHFSNYAFEGIFSHQFYCSPIFEFNALAGFEYAWIGVKESAFAQNTAGTTLLGIQRSRSWGIGPELGFNFDTHIWPCFSFVGRGTGAFLVARTHNNSVVTFTPAVGAPITLEYTNNPAWRVIPTWNARLGFKYEKAFSCLRTSIEAGYETVVYSNALSVINSGNNSLDYETCSATMHGPYIAASVVF